MKFAKTGLLAAIGPGILITATGVGAGDLATGAFTGSELGLAILWAVVVGAFLKCVLNEGLTRWQLVTGETLLEGSLTRLGRPVLWVFLPYFLIWTIGVSTALMSACGVAAHALIPLNPGNPALDKIIYGLIHSAIAVALVRYGGYQLFEKVMSVCIAVMFVTVLTTACMVGPDWGGVLRGLTLPTIPRLKDDGFQWTMALMGGVGGTVTVLCYGYWIREEKREGVEHLKNCRIDLIVGYVMTAIFGFAMIIIGDRIDTSGKGSTLIVQLGASLEADLGGRPGAFAKWAFTIGGWGAIASSLLGVWQSAPYLFCDLCRIGFPKTDTEGNPVPSSVDVNSKAYRAYLYAMAIFPGLLLAFDFKTVQKLNAILGAAFMPMLAIVLLILNGSDKHIGREHKNSPYTTTVLIATLLFFLAFAAMEVAKKLNVL